MNETEWIELIYEVNAEDAQKAEEIAGDCTSLGVYTENYSELDSILLTDKADYIDNALSQKDKSHALIHIYVSSEREKGQMEAAISDRLRRAKVSFTIKTRELENEDWENAWKKYHKPRRVGKNLIICPTWENCTPGSNDKIIALDPGACFGSGADETTRLCMEMIEELPVVGARVLDLGCGSGILGITALVLGADFVMSTDIDPKAVSTAKENAGINGVLSRFKAHLGNVLTDERLALSIGGDYDLVCANIVADVHIEMAKLYFSKLKKGGRLIVGGIREERKMDVERALKENTFLLLSSLEENGWCAMCFGK